MRVGTHLADGERAVVCLDQHPQRMLEVLDADEAGAGDVEQSEERAHHRLFREERAQHLRLQPLLPRGHRLPGLRVRRQPEVRGELRERDVPVAVAVDRAHELLHRPIG